MSDTYVDFTGWENKAVVLIALWNATKALGMGALHAHMQPTLEDAETQLKHNDYVDYFNGKPIKCDFEDFPKLRSYSYDRDAGQGAMLKVAQKLAKQVPLQEKLTDEEAQTLVDTCESAIVIQSYDEWKNHKV